MKRLPFPVDYHPPSLHAWRRYWRPEFQMVGLPTLGPVQLAGRADAERRRYLIADDKADTALADLSAELARYHAPRVRQLLDRYQRHRANATRRVDLVRLLSAAELTYLRPIVWRAEEWFSAR